MFSDPLLLHAQDGAIEALVAEKLRGRWLFASANVANHPLLSRLHARLGALLPFKPPMPLNTCSVRGADPEQALRDQSLAVQSSGAVSQGGEPHWQLPAGFSPAGNVLDDTPAAQSRWACEGSHAPPALPYARMAACRCNLQL